MEDGVWAERDFKKLKSVSVISSFNFSSDDFKVRSSNTARILCKTSLKNKS
jgi:hypothetical protein